VKHKIKVFPYAHIDDEDLELYYMERITNEAALEKLAEHLIECHACAKRALDLWWVLDLLCRARRHQAGMRPN
jgi:hypothetical protein